MQPTLHAIFRRLSELTGNSQSQIVFELLDGSQDHLMKVIQLLEAAQDARQGMNGKIGFDLAEAHDRVERQLGLVLEQLGEPEYIHESHFTERVPFRSRPIPGKGYPSSKMPQLVVKKPPASNRGVRYLTKQEKTTKAGQKS